LSLTGQRLSRLRSTMAYVVPQHGSGARLPNLDTGAGIPIALGECPEEGYRGVEDRLTTAVLAPREVRNKACWTSTAELLEGPRRQLYPATAMMPFPMRT
jgi:hypothetical protein